jgi:hypothetical protein
MSAEVIKSLVPFGIFGLAIVALVTIATVPSKAGYWAMLPMVLIAALTLADRLLFPSIYWVDTGLSADWGGQDYASTESSTPKYQVKDTKLCDDNRIGYVATCWDSRPSGYPAVRLTDISPGAKPEQWCTYKDNAVRLSTSPNGSAPAGRVYICGHAISASLIR